MRDAEREAEIRARWTGADTQDLHEVVRQRHAALKDLAFLLRLLDEERAAEHLMVETNAKVKELRAALAEAREALKDVERLAGLATNACDDYDGMGRDPVLGYSLAKQAFERVRAWLEANKE